MKSNWLVCLTLALMLLLVACKSPTTPSPTHSPLPTSSPLKTPTPAPSSVPTPVPEEIVPFRLDKPIVEGTDRVSGTGPAGVPIVLVDVTFMGPILGSGVIKSDGTFVINVPTLEKAHRIGLAIGDLSGTQWAAEDFRALEYRGDEPQQVPQVGFFHDTAMVQEE
jgi:hypothetical protein